DALGIAAQDHAEGPAEVGLKVLVVRVRLGRALRRLRHEPMISSSLPLAGRCSAMQTICVAAELSGGTANASFSARLKRPYRWVRQSCPGRLGRAGVAGGAPMHRGDPVGPL